MKSDVPDWLLAEACLPSYWEDFFEFGGGETEYPELTCRLNVDEDHFVHLTATRQNEIIGLSIGYPGVEQPGHSIGFDDDAAFEPHVLRWEEVELVARCVALNDARIPHPGLVVLLLCRFAPICVGDEVDAIYAVLDAAWRRLVPAGTPQQGAEFFEHYDRRDDGFVWRRSASGDVIDELFESYRGLYTRRGEGDDDFPFTGLASLLEAARRQVAAYVAALQTNGEVVEEARRYAEALAQPGPPPVSSLAAAIRAAGSRNVTLDRACSDDADPLETTWVVEELLGVGRGTLVKLMAAPTRPTRPRHSLRLITPSLPGQSDRDLRDALDSSLRAQGVGRATIAGSEGFFDEDGNHHWTRSFVDIDLRGDLFEGITAIRNALNRFEVMPGSRLLLQEKEGATEIPI